MTGREALVERMAEAMLNAPELPGHEQDIRKMARVALAVVEAEQGAPKTTTTAPFVVIHPSLQPTSSTMLGLGVERRKVAT